jgi:hypothetical protein
VHLPWSKVPRAIHEWAEQFGGQPIDAIDLAGGFSPGATARLRFADRDDVFIKAVGTSLNPESPEFHRREGVISGSLPSSSLWPRILATFDDGDWVALAFLAIDGHLPHHPWRDQDLETVLRALTVMHEQLTPSPSPLVESAVARRSHMFYGWRYLSEQAVGTDDLDPWARDHLDQLVQMESLWPEACQGETLLHGDLRSDNMLLSEGGVTFVDWPHAMVGHAALDLVCWAPSVVLEGGPLPEELMARHAPSRDADTSAVQAMVAAISGFFIQASLRPPPPGLPTLRPFQAAQGRVALEWLQRSTGW